MIIARTMGHSTAQIVMLEQSDSIYLESSPATAESHWLPEATEPKWPLAMQRWRRAE